MPRKAPTSKSTASTPRVDLAYRPRGYRWPRASSHVAAASAAETVIARVTLATPHRDAVTLRGRRGADARIRYRMVHEGAAGPRICVRPASSERPLSLGEIVELIDGAYYEGACADPFDQECYGRVIWGTLKLQFEHGVAGADDYLFFATVESPYYPQLDAYYRERMADWCLEHCEEEEACGNNIRMRLRRG